MLTWHTLVALRSKESWVASVRWKPVKLVKRTKAHGKKIIKMIWAEPVQKGAKVRMRLCVQEIAKKGQKRLDVVAATPNSSGTRVLTLIAQAEGLDVGTAAFHRAFFHAPRDEEGFRAPPAEA